MTLEDFRQQRVGRTYLVSRFIVINVRSNFGIALRACPPVTGQGVVRVFELRVRTGTTRNARRTIVNKTQY